MSLTSFMTSVLLDRVPATCKNGESRFADEEQWASMHARCASQSSCGSVPHKWPQPLPVFQHPSTQPRTLTMASCSCSCVPMAIMCALLVYSCVVAFRVRTSSLASSRADATSPRLAASLTCFCACFSSLLKARNYDGPAGLAA
jgi:hypothetical protein